MTVRPDQRRVLTAIVRSDFGAFLHMCFRTVSPGDVYCGNWHLEAIGHQLERVERGELSRLIVTVPPRSLKSITISVAWVAWRLGHDPSQRFLCVSYSQELSLKHARDCRAVMTSDWYQSAFPGTVLSRERNAEHDFQTTARGGRFSTSVGGTLTGRGGDVIVIDDPLKPEEAMSEAARTLTLDWFANTLSSRLNDKIHGAMILVMQRLHEDDLAGHLLEAGGWEQLRLPAIASEDEEISLGNGRQFRRRAGDLLHPEREPRAVLDAMKMAMGSAVFAAQYQQEPVPQDGALIQRDWLRRYDKPPVRQTGDRIVQSWDTASKEGVQNDFSVCITALLRKREVYVLDVFRERLSFPKLYRTVVKLAQRHRAAFVLVEDAASGTQLIQQLCDQQPQGVPLPIRRRPEADKVTRMSGASARVEAGELLLPCEAPWLADFERELLGFPNGRHDDQVDALAQLLGWASHRFEFDEGPPGVPILFLADGRQIGGFPWEADNSV